MTTLSDAEVYRIKAALGFNVLGIGAEPYIGTRPIFQVIRDNVSSSSVAPTTSTTSVTATGAVTLTLASVTGITAGMRVQLDMDQLRETCSVQVVSGSTIRVNARKLHSQPYVVEVESPLTLVRGVLSDLTQLEQGNALDAFATLGLKSVDEVVWQDGANVSALVAATQRRLSAQLARLCGIYEYWQSQTGQSGSVEVY